MVCGVVDAAQEQQRAEGGAGADHSDEHAEAFAAAEAVLGEDDEQRARRAGRERGEELPDGQGFEERYLY